MTLLLGLTLAAGTAILSQVGFLFRERGATAAPDVDARHPIHTVVCLFRQKWWTFGYFLAFLAYLCHVGALGLIDLSMVQAVLAGGLVVLAVVAERFFGFEVEKKQWIGVSLAAGGLALLALTGDVRSGEKTAEYSMGAMIAWEAVMIAIGTALILSHRMERMRGQMGVCLGIAAGLLFTMTHVAVKALTAKADNGLLEVLASPYLYLAIAGGIVAFFASARSLQVGPGVAVIAVTSIAGNASSIPAGIVVFGDPLGSDAFSVTIRTLAFVLVIAAAALIPAPTRVSADDEPQQSERETAVPAPTAGRLVSSTG